MSKQGRVKLAPLLCDDSNEVIQAMQDMPWLRPLVWMDYRLALLLTVIIPLVLLIWAFVKKAETMQRLLLIYWRVASLLAITVYLMIAALPISFIASLMSRVLIPISLWFWVDLNEEIAEQPSSPLKLSFTSWRWAVTIYSILGAVTQIPLLRCATLSMPQMLDTPYCQIWLEAPWAFREMFHGGSKPYFLGFLGIVALIVYVLYLGYFVLFRLGKQGRSATGY
jgi:hypothetical protein